MIEMNIKIMPVKQPNDSSILYRYVTIDKLLDFLFCNRIPLVRLNIFDDKLEGVSVDHLLVNLASTKIAQETASWIGGTFKSIVLNLNPTKRNSLRKQREIFQDTNYANCWYISDYESVAMWKLYSNPDSVAIRVPYAILKDEILNYNFELTYEDFENLRFGCVDYFKFNDLDKLTDIVGIHKDPGFFKDLSFKHENEFRIILQTQIEEKRPAVRNPFVLDEQIEMVNRMMDVKVIYMTLTRFKSLPFEIVFHPQSSDWHRANVVNVINKFELPFKTSESTLRDIFN
jgi:hypothetical protein